ncbi:hypothetical protein GCM10022215_07400 [Nocardioides fonticola]|uniref:ABC transporter domain-containing protein n=1 Tax=Nocardioides fonticola TaxID=450363 RepID=A0ABP7XD30_9ACTN
MIVRTPAEGSRRPGLALVGALLLAWFGLRYPGFLSVDNLSTIALSSSFVLIGSIGTMALLVCGQVDLSIGSQYALVSVVCALVGHHTGSSWSAAGAALTTGMLLGAINGLLVNLLRVTPLIVTLGTLGIYGGLAYAANQGQTVFGLPPGLTDFGRATVAGVQVTVLVGVAVFVISSVLLVGTVTGLRLYATGGNPSASALVGVRVPRLVVVTFALNGLLVGLVGLVSTAQLASGSPQVGVDFELHVLAAVILGGVAFTGGRGHPLGVLIAVAVIGVLDAGLIFAGLDDWWQQITQGGVLLVALAADQAVIARRERRIRTGATRSPLPVRAPAVPARRTRDDSGQSGIVVAVDDLTVRFVGSEALRSVSLDIRAGEVVCLVGDNGAGKSTLALCLAGAVRPAEGTIALDGVPLTADPGRARRLGVETVHQDLALCPNLSIADNLAVGQEPRRHLGGIPLLRDNEAAEREARSRLDELGIGIDDLRRPIRYLSGGERQLVQILRVMRPGVRVVIMDEPTAALGLNQATEVRALVRAIAASGTPVLLITHDVEEVFDVADRVLVLQRGELVFDGPVGEVSRIDLLRMMSGRTRLQAAQILEAVGSERRRIERDLHDGAQQGLVTSALMLNLARQRLHERAGAADDVGDVVDLLDSCAQTLQTSLAEMRSFSRGLQAGVLEREGLVGAVRVLADRAPVLVDLRAADVPRLPPPIERAAYFVVAESLTNALKHAGAGRITIEIALDTSSRGDLLEVSVVDDGIGFDHPGDGTGIAGLHERIAPVHGVLEIDSAPGAGTTVSAQFPVLGLPPTADDLSAPPERNHHVQP